MFGSRKGVEFGAWEGIVGVGLVMSLWGFWEGLVLEVWGFDSGFDYG